MHRAHNHTVELAQKMPPSLSYVLEYLYRYLSSWSAPKASNALSLINTTTDNYPKMNYFPHLPRTLPASFPSSPLILPSSLTRPVPHHPSHFTHHPAVFTQLLYSKPAGRLREVGNFKRSFDFWPQIIAILFYFNLSVRSSIIRTYAKLNRTNDSFNLCQAGLPNVISADTAISLPVDPNVNDDNLDRKEFFSPYYILRSILLYLHSITNLYSRNSPYLHFDKHSTGTCVHWSHFSYSNRVVEK